MTIILKYHKIEYILFFFLSKILQQEIPAVENSLLYYIIPFLLYYPSLYTKLDSFNHIYIAEWIILVIYYFLSKVIKSLKLMLIAFFTGQILIVILCSSEFLDVLSFLVLTYEIIVYMMIIVILVFTGMLIVEKIDIPITIKRKYFHFCILVLFIPPIKANIDCFIVCSLSILILFLYIEIIRKYTNNLNFHILQFIDSKDKLSSIILSPLSLLVGSVIPVCLYTLDTGVPKLTIAYSGILSLGLEDSFVFTSLYF